MEKKLQVGLVGLGKMGSYHLDKLLRHPDVELLGIYDKDQTRSAQVATDFGLKVFSTPEELFFEVDAVFIASPTRTHFELGLKALNNDLHVFIEKPICDRVELAAELVRVADEKKLIFQTGFVERYRWFSLVKQLPGMFKQKPLLISTERNSVVPSREKGMDVITDLMIHDIDLVLWMVQEPPVSIFAEGGSAGQTDIDLAQVRLEFPSGTVAYLKASWVASERHRETQLFWNDRIINCDLLSGTAEVLETGSDRPIDRQTYPLIQTDSLTEQVNAFVKSVKRIAPIAVSGTEGLRALEVSEAIKQKIREKQSEKIRISPLEKKFLSRYWGEHVN
ncbi:MAG: Gfo/Idh/MocA family protein [Pseudomonadota bacterium]